MDTENEQENSVWQQQMNNNNINNRRTLRTMRTKTSSSSTTTSSPPPPQLNTLLADAIRNILDHCADFDTILNLGNSQSGIYYDSNHITKRRINDCHNNNNDVENNKLNDIVSETTAIATTPPSTSTSTSTRRSTSIFKEIIFQQGWKCSNCMEFIFVSPQLDLSSKFSKPFICAVCHGKFCGETIDYNKRQCRCQICDGCGKMECFQCMMKHLEESNSDGYGTENYCQDCQAEFEFGMGGC